ncbi:MAG: cytochrome c [Rhodospirillales bacterium]|nr:cytochrome c [Rhodospirillales bacterium]
MHQSLKFLFGLALAFAIVASTAPTYAGSPADTIKERRALMKNNGGHVKGIVGFLKKGMGTAADAAGHADAIAANAAKIVALYPRGTGPDDNVGKTRAKAAIWTDGAKFEASAANLKTLAMNLASAARGGDKKAIGMAMGAMGKQGCGGCHKVFRAKKK